MEKEICKIIPLLLNDGILLGNILQFADALGTVQSDKIILSTQIKNGTVNYYDSIKKLLESWISKGRRKNVADLLQLLRGIGFENVAESILRAFSVTNSHKLTKEIKTWNLLPPVSNFVGREEEIRQLNVFFKTKHQRILVISGMGGQGKTQLCMKWIQILKKKKNCPRIIWLAGEDGSALLASTVGFVEKETQAFNESTVNGLEEIMQLTLNVMGDERILWVVDGVDKIYAEINTFATFLFINAQNSKVLITSRQRTFLPETAEYLILETLPPAVAHQLVHKNVKPVPEESDVSALCTEMGCHALALQLSIGFIKGKRLRSARGFGIRDFLKLFREEDEFLENFLDKKQEIGYDKPVRHHVRMFMMHLKEKEEQTAQDIMKILSFLRSDGVEFGFLFNLVFITNPKFKNYTEIQRGEVEVEEALEVLKSLSLITAELPIIWVHPLIQETMRIQFPDYVTVADTILTCVEIMNMSSRELQHVLRLWEIISRVDGLLKTHSAKIVEIYLALLKNTYIESLLPLTNSHRNNLRRLSGNLSSKRESIRAELYYCKALIESGNYENALELLRSAGDEASEHLPGDDIISLNIEHAKAHALGMLKKTEEVIDVHKKLTLRYVAIYGTNHKETMDIKNNFAVTLSNCNKNVEALAIFKEVLKWRKVNCGILDPNTLQSRHNIIICYLEDGNVEKAESELKKVFDWTNEQHSETLLARFWLARICHAKGDHEEANRLLEKALVAELEKCLPASNFPESLSHRYNRALSFVRREKIEKALGELEEVMELEFRASGSKQSDADIAKNLYKVYGYEQ